MDKDAAKVDELKKPVWAFLIRCFVLIHCPALMCRKVGRMKYLLNHKEMKAVDMYSIHTVGIPSLVLMERAALSVVKHLTEKITKKDKVLAVSGSGNNGADAVAVARILHNMGYETAVYLAADPNRISEELKVQMAIVEKLDMPVFIQTASGVRAAETYGDKKEIQAETCTENIYMAPCMKDYDWIVDGVFGIGLSRTVEGHYADVIRLINDSGAKVCAVDIPSGIFADNGQILGCAVKADLTVTFGYVKAGMIFYPGAVYAGELYVEDIGFVKDSHKIVKPHLQAIEDSDIPKLLPKRSPWSNKGSYGKLLVIAGKKNMCGAACLCGKAAYKMGTGLVKIASPEENRQIIQTMLPEAVLDTYSLEALDKAWIEKQLAWASAIVIGPGMGTGCETELFLQCVLDQEKPVVVDADGLNVLAGHLDWLKNHKCPVIVTPHLGEMSRLTGLSIAQIQETLVETCESFAAKYNVVCVLKDARTIISDGQGHTFVNTSGNNGMSTGGSGDVLAGIIGGMVCQKDEAQPLYLTAAGGVYIHGRSGDAAKKFTGVYGLLASDIIQYISNIVNL